MNEAEFRQLVCDSTEFLQARIARAREEFGIGEFERYDYDLPTNRFWWSDAGVPQVEARIIIVGSISTTSNTWLTATHTGEASGLKATGHEVAFEGMTWLRFEDRKIVAGWIGGIKPHCFSSFNRVERLSNYAVTR